MSRYIDADKMIADLLTVDPQYETMIRWCCDVTNAQPTADVVKVVQCKDCKWWDKEEHNCAIRDSYGWDYKPTDYCSYGERKDNE